MKRIMFGLTEHKSLPGKVWPNIKCSTKWTFADGPFDVNLFPVAEPLNGLNVHVRHSPNGVLALEFTDTNSS